MWNNFLIAIALMLVIEGVIPFLNPDTFKKSLMLIIQMDNKNIRIAGFFSMIAGVVLLYIVN